LETLDEKIGERIEFLAKKDSVIQALSSEARTIWKTGKDRKCTDLYSVLTSAKILAIKNILGMFFFPCQ
jgi:hypothetical protein